MKLRKEMCRGIRCAQTFGLGLILLSFSGRAQLPQSTVSLPEIPGIGGSVQAPVIGAAWRVEYPSADWVNVSPEAGSGDAVVTIAAGPNANCAPRSCWVMIGGQAIQVTQGPGGGVTQVDPLITTVGQDGGQIAVEVTETTGCPWTLSTTADWITIVSAERQNEKVLLLCTVNPNDRAEVRTANIQAGDLTSAVAQSARLTAPNPGRYYGLFADGFLRPGSSGLLTLKAGRTAGRFTAVVVLASERYSTSGSFDSSGLAQCLIRRRHAPALELELRVTSPDEICGTVSDGTWSATVQANRCCYDGKNAVAPQAGQHTLVLEPAANALSVQAGNGYGTLKVDKAGNVRLAGALPDGTKLTQAVGIGLQGQWPVFIPLHSRKGSLAGRITISGDRELEGDVRWAKPDTGSAKAKSHQEGFELKMQARGCEFLGAYVENKVLDIWYGEVAMWGGPLPSSISVGFVWDDRNRILAEDSKPLVLKFSRATGKISGKVKNTSGVKELRFTGVVLQHWNYGSGFFLSENGGGAVVIQNSSR